MNYSKRILYYLFTVLSAMTFFSCANRGQGPQGGPKDTIPPGVVKAYPADKSLNVKKKKIEIIFDENVTVQKASEKVIVSPPQLVPPSIQAYGKSVIAEFNDTLRSNTTYSINFGDAIVDNNEGNKLKNYVYSFSTGNTIDTLQIAGTLIDAENLNPMQGITVGIYNDFSDSAFYKTPFLRISRTDEKGAFTVPNVKSGTYKARALKDDNKDNKLQAGEGLAFNDSIFSPSAEVYERRDTLWKDSVKIDTVKIVKSVRFQPENILMRYFKESHNKKQRFVKSERRERHSFTLFFSAPAKELPTLEPINLSATEKMLLQKNATMDTLTYWLTDNENIKKDTLSFKMKYLKTDSTNRLDYTTDTLRVVFRRAGKNPPTDNKREGKEFLGIRTDLSHNFDVYKPVTVSFDVPVSNWDSTKIHLNEMKDTIPTAVKFNIRKKDELGMEFEIIHKWKPESIYFLSIDSAAFYSIYGLHTNKLRTDFSIKSPDEYSSLKLLLADFNPDVVFQVLNTKDEPVSQVPANEKGAKVEYLSPGDYYIRLFIDKNRNGKWDTGNYNERRQPEEVYYYPKKLTLIKNWEVEETIDYLKVPLLQQKPTELIKKAEKN